jgi:hypothetical protein
LRAAKRRIIFPDVEFQDLSRLTPNAPMSGAGVRSTEASAPLAGWAAGSCVIRRFLVSDFACDNALPRLGLNYLYGVPTLRTRASGHVGGRCGFVDKGCFALSLGTLRCPARHRRVSLDSPQRMSLGGALLTLTASAPRAKCFLGTHCSGQACQRHGQPDNETNSGALFKEGSCSQ